MNDYSFQLYDLLKSMAHLFLLFLLFPEILSYQ